MRASAASNTGIDPSAIARRVRGPRHAASITIGVATRMIAGTIEWRRIQDRCSNPENQEAIAERSTVTFRQLRRTV